jgi:hypothetical protein
MDDDSIDSFDDLFEPFGLEGESTKDPNPQRRQSTPRSTPATTAVEGAVACVSCGAPNHPDNRHCERCGARLARSQMPVAPQPMLRTTAGARALIVLASVVLGVAILALLVNMFSGGGGGTTETTNTTPTSLPTTPIGPLTPIAVDCNPPSSELFPCEALIDGDPATSWNAIDGGIGVEITFLFAPPAQITEMIIQNVEDECRFLRNHRMKGIEVSINDLTQTIVKELDDSRDLQRVDIRSIGTSSLTIRINSGYPGQTCDGKEPYFEMAAQDVYFFGRSRSGG